MRSAYKTASMKENQKKMQPYEQPLKSSPTSSRGNLKKSPLRTERSLFMCVVLMFFLSLDKKNTTTTHMKRIRPR